MEKLVHEAIKSISPTCPYCGHVCDAATYDFFAFNSGNYTGEKEHECPSCLQVYLVTELKDCWYLCEPLINY